MCLTHEMTRKLSIHAGIFLYDAMGTIAAVVAAAAATAAAAAAAAAAAIAATGAAEMQRKYEGG